MHLIITMTPELFNKLNQYDDIYQHFVKTGGVPYNSSHPRIREIINIYSERFNINLAEFNYACANCCIEAILFAFKGYTQFKKNMVNAATVEPSMLAQSEATPVAVTPKKKRK